MDLLGLGTRWKGSEALHFLRDWNSPDRLEIVV